MSGVRADFRDDDRTLVVYDDDTKGVRIGIQALEPWYGAGVLIPPDHPAYRAAQAFVAALASTKETP